MTEHKNIHVALVAAQMEMGKAVKDSQNPHFKSKYADLAAVMDACKSALNSNGISITHSIEWGETDRLMFTTLTHGASETTVSIPVPLLLGKQDMQGLGSAMTYARRYGIMSLTGIAPEDDDGNAAAKSAPNAAQRGLQDAWKDSVLDGLPDNATARDRASAFADAIIAEFKGKGEKALQNAWERRKKYIAELEAKHDDLYRSVVEAYEHEMTRFDPTMDEIAADVAAE